MRTVTFPVQDDDLYYFFRNKQTNMFLINSITSVKRMNYGVCCGQKVYPWILLLHKLRLKKEKNWEKQALTCELTKHIDEFRDAVPWWGNNQHKHWRNVYRGKLCGFSGSGTAVVTSCWNIITAMKWQRWQLMCQRHTNPSYRSDNLVWLLSKDNFITCWSVI